MYVCVCVLSLSICCLAQSLYFCFVYAEYWVVLVGPVFNYSVYMVHMWSLRISGCHRNAGFSFEGN
jgi:hypothetical protein